MCSSDLFPSHDKWAAVTDVQARAAESEDIDKYRMFSENKAKKRNAMMPVNTGEEFFPVQGVGTNVLAKNGAEIANTFAPGTIYDDAGYEPLDDSNQVKQFDYGGKLPKAFQGMEMMVVNPFILLIMRGIILCIWSIRNWLIERRMFCLEGD